MHICFITHEYPKKGFPHGGIGSFVQTLAKACVAQGVTVTVVGIGYTHTYEEAVDCGVHIYRIARSNAKFGKFIDNSKKINHTLKEIHEKTPIDIIEGAELEFAFIKKIPAVKYVIRMHGGHHFFAKTLHKEVNKWKAFKEKRSFLKADFFIAVSDFVGIKTAELLNRKIKYKRIYNFVDIAKFKSEVGINVDDNKITFIGTVCEKKGVRQLIQAMPLINQAFPNAYLEVIGRDWFFPNGKSYIAFLKETVANADFKNINFRGVVSYEQIPLYIDTAKLCVFPSHMESFGLTIIEAMAMNKPIVVSDIAPFKEIVGKTNSVLFCNPQSPEDIAEKVIYSLQHQKEIKDKANLAKKRIVNMFSKDKIIKENIAYFKSICKI
ncbi:MAG: glycosyltransferase family 4 protein [Flavobacteriaceae bacterium]|nr:glycosyltransferase family 4 protein [Flavobacteriaceae bacterium]